MRKLYVNYPKDEWDAISRYAKNDYDMNGRSKESTNYDIKQIIKKLNFKPKDIVLDIGPGNGILFKFLLETGNIKKGIGIDPGEDSVLRLKTLFKNDPKINFIKSEAYEIPFKNKTFDKIVMNSIIQYFYNIENVVKTLKEIKRVSKSHATIYIGDVPSTNDLYKLGVKNSLRRIFFNIKKEGIFKTLRKISIMIKKRVNEPKIIVKNQSTIFFKPEEFIKLCRKNNLYGNFERHYSIEKGKIVETNRFDYIFHIKNDK